MAEDQGVSTDQAGGGTEQAVADTEHDESKAFEGETKEDKAEELGLDVDELEEKKPDEKAGEQAEAEKVATEKAAAEKAAKETPEAKEEREAAEKEATEKDETEAREKLLAEETEEDKVKREADEEAAEDITRGQELLDKRKEAEATKVAEEAVKATEQPAEHSPFTQANTAEDIEFFKTVLPENLLPKGEIELKDGTKLDFEYYQKENPEALPVVAAVAKNLVDQMRVKNADGISHLATGTDIEDIRTYIDNALFLRTVTNKVDGVPKAQEIHDGEDFKKWLPNQPETIQALMESDDPYDHIRVFNRFINKEGLETAKEKVVDLDTKRKAAKKKADSFHKTTVKSKKTGTHQSAVDGDQEETDAFESDEDDDDINY